MEIRLTRRLGQSGTKKLFERYGQRPICVRYRYDAQNNCRHKPIELILETVPWRPNARRARRRDLATTATPLGNALARRQAARNQRSR